MLENVASGIIVAVILSLTAFAWKNPAGYQSVYKHIWGISVTALMLVLMWNMATSIFLDYFEEFFEIAKFIEAREKLKSIQVPYGSVLAVYVATMLYTSLLLLIPKFKPE